MADLRALLGSAALPCPALDIGPAFAAAVVAALGTQKAKDIPFSPYDNDLFFLHGACCPSACCPARTSGCGCMPHTPTGSNLPLFLLLFDRGSWPVAYSSKAPSAYQLVLRCQAAPGMTAAAQSLQHDMGPSCIMFLLHSHV